MQVLNIVRKIRHQHINHIVKILKCSGEIIYTAYNKSDSKQLRDNILVLNTLSSLGKLLINKIILDEHENLHVAYDYPNHGEVMPSKAYLSVENLIDISNWLNKNRSEYLKNG